MKIKQMKPIMIILVFMVVSMHAADATAQNVQRITKEALLDILDQPDVVIIDVRTTMNWQDSDNKIKGAQREMPKNFDSWGGQYPKDKILVLY